MQKGDYYTKGNVMKNKYVVYGLVFLAGVMLANKVRALPVLNKLPSA